MDDAKLLDVVIGGITHDPAAALAELEGVPDTAAAQAVLLVLLCRYDDALVVADELEANSTGLRDDMAVRLVRSVAEAEVDDHPIEFGDDLLASMLTVWATMTAGRWEVAQAAMPSEVWHNPTESGFKLWGAIGMIRAWGQQGRLSEARALIDEVHDAEDLGPPLSAIVLGARAYVDGLSGSERVGTWVRQLREGFPEPDQYVTVDAYWLAACGLAAAGQLPEARELLLIGGGGRDLHQFPMADRLVGVEILIADAMRREDFPEILDLRDRLRVLKVGDHPMAQSALNRISALLAMLDGDQLAAAKASRRAKVQASLAGGTIASLHAEVLEGMALARGQDVDAGVLRIETAAQRAAEIGAATLVSWAEEELKAHGRRLRNAPGLGWEALNDVQQAVARLAASGLRNREIAEMLRLSERSVEAHVSAILTALGTVNRVGIGHHLSGSSTDVAVDARLTGRQQEVAELVLRGLSNAQISSTLGISEKTVEKHVAALFRRVGVKSRSALAAALRSA